MHDEHGARTECVMNGKGLAASQAPTLRGAGLMADPASTAPAPPPSDPSQTLRFCHLFPTLAPFQPNDAGLIALGRAMEDTESPDSANSPIPSGFTYLGQFINHDITCGQTRNMSSSLPKLEESEPGRSPTLDLESVYGRGPRLSPELYDTDGIRLRLGITTGRPRFGVTQVFPNDVPRRPVSDPEAPKQAIVGDPRNDENLAVAQTHVAFLKFHNKVVGHLQAAGVDTSQLFDKAYKTVVQHYQSIVLHDFVRRVTNSTVHNDVLSNGRSFFVPRGVPAGTPLSMPMEFVFAAYRFGHSMVRNAYQWNRVFNTQARARSIPMLRSLFELSKGSGNLGGCDTLPSDWIADWRRLYDFSERSGGVRHPQLNFARLIDTKLARRLQLLPEFANAAEEHWKSLAVRDLLRGRLMGLPTGQDVARAMGMTPLSPLDVASGPHATTVQAHDFDTHTPLWYYILKEAEVQEGGQLLGQVGSRIVVETFHGLIEGSSYSILQQGGWQPDLPSQDCDRFTMLDLFVFVDDINPLCGW